MSTRDGDGLVSFRPLDVPSTSPSKDFEDVIGIAAVPLCPHSHPLVLVLRSFTALDAFVFEPSKSAVKAL
jgi:hypothetical protein